jgi:hypothetical protein
MNPMGLIIIGLGIIIFIIGFKGSQHNVINAFKGVVGAKPTTPPNPSPTPNQPSPSGINPATLQGIA